MNGWNFQELHETPSQTGGPYVHIGLMPNQAGIEVFEHSFGNQLVQAQTKGERIRLEGQVLDGLGLPIRDVLVEIWQADAEGIYPSPADLQGKQADPHFFGWGRAAADFETGMWSFDTIKPGAVPGRKGTMQAPHIAMAIFARGINLGLHTRVYFDDEIDANTNDPLLNGIEWVTRRKTLIAQRQEKDGEVIYRFDVRIQGENETVFLDI